jgi:hypothetical protein
MASDDHNETFDELTINKALIDASGTRHEGELADLADTGGGDGSGSDVSVSDDDTIVVDPATDINFGTFLNVSDDGDGTVTVTGVNTDTDTHVTVENVDGTSLVKNVASITAGNGLSFVDDGDNTATLDADPLDYSQVDPAQFTVQSGTKVDAGVVELADSGSGSGYAWIDTGVTEPGAKFTVSLGCDSDVPVDWYLNYDTRNDTNLIKLYESGSPGSDYSSPTTVAFTVYHWGTTDLSSGSDSSGDATVLFDESFDDTSYRDRFTYHKNDSLDTDSTAQSYASGSSMEVPFPKDSHDGMTARTRLDEEGYVSSAPREVYLDWYLYFQSDFDCYGSQGKKLPGPVNYMEDRSETDANGDGHGGDPATGYGWSTREYFWESTSSDVEVGFGVYHMDQSGDYGDKFGSHYVSKGNWHRIQQHIKLNTTDSNGNANADGVLEQWTDGTQQFSKNDFRFTDHPEEGIKVNWTTWFGGNNPSPQDQSVWIDQFVCSTDGFTDNS